MSETHRITARFSDGVELDFAAGQDRPLLTSALEAGVNLLYQCQAGSCSSCICRVLEGDMPMSSTTSIALLPSEIAEGKVLTCLATPKSDSVIELSYESALLDRDGARDFAVDVMQVEQLCETVTALTVEVDPDDEAPDFEPGMYYLITVPGTEHQRAYSTSATPGELPEMRFLIRHVEDGAMTNYVMNECVAGDQLQLRGPFGEFFLRHDDHPLVLIAGGTGLAPILAILDTIRERRRNRKRILLCFGVNRVEDLFYQDELDLRREMMPQLEVRIAVVTADQRWDGQTGYVTDLVQKDDLAVDSKVYVCGPPPMVEAARTRLSGFAVAETDIFYERFAPSAALGA